MDSVCMSIGVRTAKAHRMLNVVMVESFVVKSTEQLNVWINFLLTYNPLYLDILVFIMDLLSLFKLHQEHCSPMKPHSWPSAIDRDVFGMWKHSFTTLLLCCFSVWDGCADIPMLPRSDRTRADKIVWSKLIYRLILPWQRHRNAIEYAHRNNCWLGSGSQAFERFLMESQRPKNNLDIWSFLSSGPLTSAILVTYPVLLRVIHCSSQ